ncbi:hypothetical protein BU23DRAFT_560987 [Bimuria novae-zelandiae CBS 107.79]|uniref:Uncharacterized protein n=1 Tax=Bimuria novae-zelandiae CBS 107.79 TaxID=1447943 RepID=A0A6A5UJY3_9PLEO|nr:hypothetical protein BU23DRAFT_560987 [Bimuria novae-zelandiae CBS 107.79]
MSAPSSQMPLFSFSDPHLRARASCSPASFASDPLYTLTTTGSNRFFGPRQSMSPVPTPDEHNGVSDGLLFITGTSLEDFKTRTNMTRVRKKAMGSYLKEKKPRGTEKDAQHRPREDSMGSRSSVGSEQQDAIPNSEAIKLMDWDRRKSSHSTPELHTRLTPDAQVSRLPRISMDFVLPSAPIVVPSRTGVPLPYDETVPKPFQSIGKPLDPFQTMFQSSHPKVSVEELKFYCSRSFGTKAMGLHWIPTVVQRPHTFLSTLCLASAHYDAVHERSIESVQTLALRQEVMHLISQNLLNPETRGDDHNVVALTQLIASEIIAAEEMTLDFHERGIDAMIRTRGGLRQLGMNGRLASTISWVSLESAVLREGKPRAPYVDYCASTCTKNYPNTATIPESPLYCPRTEFETIKRSSRCSPQTMDLLKDIRMMMDLFLHETKQSRQNSLSLKNIYKKITTQYPPLSELQKTNVLASNGWMYEAIRIAATLTATSIMQRMPLSEALKHTAKTEKAQSGTPSAILTSNAGISPTSPRQDSPLTASSTSNPFTFTPTYSRPRLTSASSHRSPPDPTTTLLTHLKLALQNSNLSACWADMAGVLLWVALTVGAASRKSGEKVLNKWFKALAMRVTVVLCFEHPEAIHASLLRMGDLVEGVRGGREAVDEGVKKRKP